MWRARAVAALAVAVIVALGLGIRLLDRSGTFGQHAGTALYASMVYAGVFVAAPSVRPVTAGVVATLFCWSVELFQLTGVPAALSEHSVLARLVLGASFDAADMAWYPVGVVPLVAVHHLVSRRSRARAARPPGSSPDLTILADRER